MNEFREKLVDRMIHLYGFENPIVIDFCKLCENWAKGEDWDMLLKILVEAHEENPQYIS